MCATLLLAPPRADANLTDNERFVIFPRLHDHKDPINVLWHGGSDQWKDLATGEIRESCRGTAGARSHTCTRDHFAVDWWRGQIRPRPCAGDGTLKFYKQGGGKTSASEQDESMVTSETCKREFHTRIWDDVEHGHSNDGPHQWNVSPIHHENRGVVETGHNIDMSWEAVENVARIQLGRRQQDQNPEPRHCTYPNYHTFKGTGPGKIKGHYSNGRVTRISYHHIDDGGCHGA